MMASWCWPSSASSSTCGSNSLAKWVPVPKPAAPLTPVDPKPVLEPDGRYSQVFITVNGKRFVEVVEPSGFVLWLQEVQQ